MPELRRELGLRDLVLMNFIAVAGIRWLASAAHVGPSSLILWVLAAVLFFIPSALAVATLSRLQPAQGGLYIWTREAFGEWHGFLCGWCYWLSNLFYFPNLVIAGISMAAVSLGMNESALHPLSLSLVILWIALLPHIFGLKSGKWLGSAGALTTYAAGALLVAFGIAAAIRGGSATPIDLAAKWDFDKLNFWSQIAFGFGGLELSAILAGEIRNPERNIPRAAWLSGGAVASFYILGTLSLLILLPSSQISILSGLVQAGNSAGERFGIGGLGAVIGILVCAGIVGQLGTWVGGAARIPFVLGLDRYLPEAFARLHPRWHTPHVAILVQGGMAMLFLLAMQAGETLRSGYQLMVDMTVITYFIPFVYLFGCAWKAGLRWSAAAGIFTTLAALGLSLVPPPGTVSLVWFELKLIGGSALLLGAARLWFARPRRPVLESKRDPLEFHNAPIEH